jgi:hypothetical protein
VVATLVILLTAVCYYGSYLRFWFNPHDEGGTAAFIAMRLMAGEMPLRDVDLSYNIGWFAPIVWLFKTAGVDFVLMRAYFFALSTVTALLGWALVRRVTRSEILALLAGLALVVFPGSQFKNYIPLICIANTLAIACAALGSGSSAPAFWRRVAVGGFVLGASMLVRIDITYLFLLLWLGVIGLRLFDSRLPRKGRFLDAIGAAAVLAAGALITHIPAVAVAHSGGYGKRFVTQYMGMAEFLGGQASTVATSGELSTTPEQALDASAKKPRAGKRPRIDRTTLPRVSWEVAKSFEKMDKSALFALTYAPLIVYLVLFAWAAWGVLSTIVRGTFSLAQPSAIALFLLFGSLTTFPQFFFFRPDRPHLSEFMPGFLLATVCAVWLAGGRLRWAVGTVLALQFALFGWFAFDHYSAGTIAARTTIKRKQRKFFEGANGVRVWVHKKDFDEFDRVRRAVVDHSKPGDWLVCYPYQPGYNLMCDRPTYERKLYLDNANATDDWAPKAIARLKDKNPAVVIIDNRPINQVESSRFSVWARPVYEDVRANYVCVEKIDTIEVYARDAKSGVIGDATGAPSPAPKEP